MDHSNRGQIRFAWAVLAFYALLAAQGYVMFADVSFTDAFFMVVISISTVGYSEVFPLDTPLLKWYTIVLIVGGIGLFFWVISETAQFLIREQVKLILGRSTMQKQIDKMHDHYIVCGYGRMGRAVIETLGRDRREILIIEKAVERRFELEETGIPFLIGDAADEAVLAAAHVESAAALIAATGSDAENIYITFSARAAHPELQIVARCDHEGAEPKLIRAGADRVISPYRASAQKAALTLRSPAVVNFMDLANNGDVQTQFEEIRVQAKSPICGKSLAELRSTDDHNATIVGIQSDDGSLQFNPPPGRKVEAADTLIVFGDAHALVTMARQAAR